jgi:hypothetical protein
MPPTKPFDLQRLGVVIVVSLRIGIPTNAATPSCDLPLADRCIQNSAGFNLVFVLDTPQTPPLFVSSGLFPAFVALL